MTKYKSASSILRTLARDQSTLLTDTQAPSTLIRFQTKTERFASTLIVFVPFSPVHTTTIIKREATWNRLFPILNTHGRVGWRPVVSIWTTSPFSDSIVFIVHTKKQRFQKASFSNRSTLESVFE